MGVSVKVHLGVPVGGGHHLGEVDHGDVLLLVDLDANHTVKCQDWNPKMARLMFNLKEEDDLEAVSGKDSPVSKGNQTVSSVGNDCRAEATHQQRRFRGTCCRSETMKLCMPMSAELHSAWRYSEACLASLSNLGHPNLMRTDT